MDRQVVAVANLNASHGTIELDVLLRPILFGCLRAGSRGRRWKRGDQGAGICGGDHSRV